MAKTNYSPTFPMYPGDAAVVTTSDTNNLREPSVVFVGSTGVLGGSVLPVHVTRVFATNTTATGLVRVF